MRAIASIYLTIVAITCFGQCHFANSSQSDASVIATIRLNRGISYDLRFTHTRYSYLVSIDPAPDSAWFALASGVRIRFTGDSLDRASINLLRTDSVIGVDMLFNGYSTQQRFHDEADRLSLLVAVNCILDGTPPQQGELSKAMLMGPVAGPRPGDLLIRAARTRNAGVVVSLLGATLGSVILLTAQNAKSADVAYGLIGGGALIGMIVHLGANGYEMEAGRALNKRLP